jgi:hypothetical protein
MNEQTTDFGSQRANGNGNPSPMDALRSAAQHLGEAKEYASTFLAAKADAAKLSIKRLVLVIAMGIIAGITGAAMLITAAVLLVNGLATGIGRIFDPDKTWLGQLIVGLLFVAGANVAVFLMIRKMMRASRDQTVQKYESRHNEQRSRFGRDVPTTAAVANATADAAG